MEKTNANPDKLIESFEEERRKPIEKLDKIIRKIMPKSAKREVWVGKFWGGTDQQIVSYGDLVYVNSKGKETPWFIVGLANQKNYITVYVNGYEDGMGLAKKYGSKLGKVKATTSAINIKNLEEVKLDELKKVISKAFELAKK